ncbi:MAG: ParB/RepB/Spo0J family partition protein [Bdellovibrionaceae bacterium]|nr:ParB/RepB/Spo0J family partition protein [Pseudobdellovibrionaceae bacterium]
MLEKDNKNTKKKSGLGRGLGSLFGEEISDPNTVANITANAPAELTNTPESAQKPSATPVPTAPPQQATAETVPFKQRIWSIDIAKISSNKEQPRKDFDAEKISELAASIKEQGILQPIVARKIGEGNYEIIAGERRWRAAQVAGLKEIPVILKEADDKQVREWALIENIQREDLNPIEEAEAYSQLLDHHGYTHQGLAERMGKDRVTITNALRLLLLPKDLRELLREQKISPGHAKALLGLENIELQRAITKDILKKGLSVRAVEKEVSKAKKGGLKTEDQGREVEDRLVDSMGTDLQKRLGTRVKIDYFKGRGKIVINFYSDDELTTICEKIKGQP